MGDLGDAPLWWTSQLPAASRSSRDWPLSRRRPCCRHGPHLKEAEEDKDDAVGIVLVLFRFLQSLLTLLMLLMDQLLSLLFNAPQSPPQSSASSSHRLTPPVRLIASPSCLSLGVLLLLLLLVGVTRLLSCRGYTPRIEVCASHFQLYSGGPLFKVRRRILLPSLEGRKYRK